MNLIKTKIKDVFILENIIFEDDRGLLCKVFNFSTFDNHNLCTCLNEIYYSISLRNVIRGMHLQLPPFDHVKLVHVPYGGVIDVILDLRKQSDTYGKYIEVDLTEENKNSVYIPKGLAHGFRSLRDGTITVYHVSTVYNKKSDSGIRWNSFGMTWGIDNPIISERDKKLVELDDFDSPF